MLVIIIKTIIRINDNIIFLDYDIKMRMIIANRTDLPNHLVEKLAHDSNANLREAIVRRIDLSDDLIKKLSEDTPPCARSDCSQFYY